MSKIVNLNLLIPLIIIFFSCTPEIKQSEENNRDSTGAQIKEQPEAEATGEIINDCNLYPPKGSLNKTISKPTNRTLLELLYPADYIKNDTVRWSCDSAHFFNGTHTEFQSTMISMNTIPGRENSIIFFCKTVPPEYECHACPAMLDAGILDKTGRDTYKLTFIDTVAAHGNMGNLSPFEVVPYGKKDFGIVFITNYTSGGTTYGEYYFYMFRDNAFRHIITFDEAFGSNEGDAEDKSKIWSYESSYRFEETKGFDIPDLIIEKTGTKRNYEDENGGIKSAAETFRYKFLGGRYVQVKE